MSDPTSTKKAATGCLTAILVLLGVVLLAAAAYRVNETEQAIITQFGKPVGEPVTEAGLHFKMPFIQKVNMIEKRILEWDGEPTEMPTKSKTYILVDTFGRWRVSDPLAFFKSLRTERRAQSRISTIIGSETRSAVADNELIEVVRTTKNREVLIDEELAEADRSGKIGALKPIEKGRSALEERILSQAAPKLADVGIELLDVRFKRINYNPSVQTRIFDRMISERQQIAERFRSEGQGEAAKIIGNMERDLRGIESDAYRKIETIRGEADAKATAIYAESYNQTPEAAELYNFVRTLQVYEEVMDKDTTLILSTDSDLFRLLKDADHKQKAAPSAPAAGP
ncbi:protease modulator HflC [Haloferula sp. A504]|uniref:protease modulator HflC n=1 Tax=Haloferula sp. A504 TaxID=3373601 RepID=UPI0031BF3194|nr:protease modulator HflC [Verrucomicrobiaceae bacterium E54]